ncbi:LutC/YkgG family protein [Corynebacterium tapiri]|uniref:Lactate utilization protein C n=1 Tax=Corynebacterium tapiri TaxID=1448266 RepID=A0A5C4U713_9CORY|nr:LUD domain-containing protein [Corynebacterium tapiri]TNL99704.1 lactate utilization protein C [Corynebacterium tapiri]
MSTAKEEILRRIRSAQKISHTAEKVEAPREYHRAGSVSGPALIEMLVDRLVDYKADVHECSSAELSNTLAEVFTERSVQNLVYAPGIDQAVLSAFEGQARADDAAANPRELSLVDAVLTESLVSCAETGTIVLESGDLCGRRALTLVPDRHVCIVRADSIVHRVPEMIERMDPTKPSTMISGPSATSDIELSRVEGVHGPRDLIVVIVRD